MIKALKFRAGINREVTSYSNEGGYFDGDKIRFRMGFPEKLGGWEKYSPNQYLGSARRLHNWIGLDSSNFLGIGTHLKYYIEEGTIFNDIMPIRKVSTNSITFSASTSANDTSAGTTTVTVTDTSHGAVENDFVTFSGVHADGLGSGGNITQAILEKEHQIINILDANRYTIVLNVLATASDSSNGGSGVDGDYQVNVGLDQVIGGTGFGAGTWNGITNGALQTTINEGGTFSNSDTTLTVASGTGIATNDVILVDNELMLVTNVATNDLTVVRAYAGTGASSNVNTAAHGGSNDTLTQADGTTITVNAVTSNVVTDAATHANGATVFLVFGNANSDNDYVGWGNAATVTVTTQIRLWSHDNFGEDLIINIKDGGLFYWDKSLGLSSRGVELSATNTFSGEKSVPTVAKQVLVSDIDRHVIAFGCDGIGGSSSAPQGDGTQDPLLIRFSSQENPVDWFPTATNTAGDLRLGAGSTFVQAVETKREILVFTDKSLHSMRFIGAPFTFGISQLASNITIMSSASAIATEDVVYWMGIDNFYVHAGQTAQLPCTVKDKVFLDFNLAQRDKVVSGINSEFGEVWWFYPSADSSECNKYVVWNYNEKVWYYGTLTRTAWLDRGIRNFPLAAGGGYVFNHELGFDDDGSAMTSFIETSPMDMGDGEKFAFIKRVIPDLSFTGSVTGSSPNATFTVKARDFPGEDFSQTGTGTTTRTATSPVEQFTNKLDYRIRGRSFAIRLDSNALGCKFKMGTPRVDIREDGRR